MCYVCQRKIIKSCFDVIVVVMAMKCVHVRSNCCNKATVPRAGWSRACEQAVAVTRLHSSGGACRPQLQLQLALSRMALRRMGKG